MTISHNHFYTGHGVSIGSETDGGVSAIRVYDLSIDGADNGFHIKSDVSGGGWVHDIAYEKVCIRGVEHPIRMDPFYSRTARGDSIPVFQDIRLKNVHIEALQPIMDDSPDVFRDVLMKNVQMGDREKIILLGYSAEHPLKVAFDGVSVEGIRQDQIRAAHALITIGPGEVNLAPQGQDVSITKIPGGKRRPLSCESAFEPYPGGPVVSALRTLPPQTSVAGKP
jgi:polygalacturonase